MIANTRFSNTILSKFFIFLFMPISLLAMDQEQQDVYNNLIPAIDNAYDQSNNQRDVVLGAYNGALLGVLQRIGNACAPSMQWANNRIAVIQIDLEKANVQFNAIESIVGKFKNLVGQAKTRQQAAQRLGQNPDANDQALLNSEALFDNRLQESRGIVQAIRNYAQRAEERLVEANNINDEIDEMIGQINVPILGNNYILQDINQSVNGVGYHRRLNEMCRSFQRFNEHIFHIKDMADTIRQDENLPGLLLALEELDEQANVLGIPR